MIPSAAAPDGELVLVELVQRDAAGNDLATRRPVDSGQRVDQGRLAAARPAGDRDELAGIDPQTHAAQRLERAGGGLERLDDIPKGDEGTAGP